MWYIQISLSTLLFKFPSISSSNYYAEHESYYFNLVLFLWRLPELLDCAITFLSNKREIPQVLTGKGVSCPELGVERGGCYIPPEALWRKPLISVCSSPSAHVNSTLNPSPCLLRTGRPSPSYQDEILRC